jgi:hypothetical protein
VLHTIGRSILAHSLHSIAKMAPQHLVVVLGQNHERIALVVAELADTLGRKVDIAMQHPDRGRGRMGRWSTATPKDFPVERMTRRCAAPKITQIQRRFESSRFAADIALLI